MIKFFEPKTKIQKNRQVLRDTDLRMAKYGRRGLISNFFIFLLCLVTSETFVSTQPTLAAVLSVGLLLSTIIRGYFLFRVESVYPRGPMAWRNKYFWATLLGACWWCVIMVSVTLVLEMKEHAPLMWLYTVVFFSTTAHAFSPYRKFLGIYQTIGLVPAAISTLFIGDILGYFYCAILLMFYWILGHHSELMATTYWDHLEANDTLKRKTEYLEEEKRDSQASAQLSNEYLELLEQQVALAKNSETSDALDSIQKSIEDFNQIVRKDYELKPRIFNIRHWLQYVVRQHQEVAEARQVEIETAISPAMPPRLLGDVQVLGRLVDTVLSEAVLQLSEGTIFVEMEFTREYESSGQLLITLACQSRSAKRKFFSEQAAFVLEPSLPLATAKGWAEALGGSIESTDAAHSGGKSLSVRLRMKVAELNPRLDYHRVAYKNKPLLLIHQNARWVDHKRQELDTLGFSVQTLKDFNKASSELLQTINKGNAALTVVYEAAVGREDASDFANELLSHNELKYTHQLVVCSTRGKKYFQDRLINASPCIHYVQKPSGLYEFEMAANEVFTDDIPGKSDAKPTAPHDVLWVALDKKSSSNKVYESEVMCIHRADDIKHIPKMMRAHPIKLVVIEHAQKHALEAVKAVREQEKLNDAENLLPIIAVGEPSIQRKMLEVGVDQFVTTDSIILGETNDLNYWLAGRHI